MIALGGVLHLRSEVSVLEVRRKINRISVSRKGN
jgi:hypothetical protein